MIRVRFEPAENGRFRRSVLFPSHDEPVVDEVEIPLDLNPGIAPHAADLHERRPQELRNLGCRIAELALGDAGLAALEAMRRGGARVRISFEEATEAAEAAAVPWELMHDGEEFLAAHPRVQLVRTARYGPFLDAVTTHRLLRLLILWAAPRDQPTIDIEWEQICLSLSLGPHLTGREIETFEVLHTTRHRLDDALAPGHYDLVYYSGHGTFEDGIGYLCLEKDDGTDLISATSFARKQAGPSGATTRSCHSQLLLERCRGRREGGGHPPTPLPRCQPAPPRGGGPLRRRHLLPCPGNHSPNFHESVLRSPPDRTALRRRGGCGGWAERSPGGALLRPCDPPDLFPVSPFHLYPRGLEPRLGGGGSQKGRPWPHSTALRSTPAPTHPGCG